MTSKNERTLTDRTDYTAGNTHIIRTDSTDRFPNVRFITYMVSLPVGGEHSLKRKILVVRRSGRDTTVDVYGPEPMAQDFRYSEDVPGDYSGVFASDGEVERFINEHMSEQGMREMHACRVREDRKARMKF